MINRRFAVEVNPDYGSIGFRPLWLKGADAYSAYTVAHDVMEHGLRDSGAEGEFRALGASVLVRGLSDYWCMQGNIHPSHEHLASDIPDIIERVRNGEETLIAPPVTRKLRNDQADEMIDATIREARKMFVMDEFQERFDGVSLRHDEADRIRGWMRIGFRNATRRYKGIDHYSLQYLFGQIEDRAAKCLNGADEGMELFVSVNLRRLTVLVDCDYPQQMGY